MSSQWGTTHHHSFPSIRRKLRYIVWSILVGWTAIISALGIVHVREEREAFLRIAFIRAEEAIEKDIIFRAWASMHGGVYVPVTDSTQPNPYLAHIPERDIATPSGRKLTLMNPAFMTRQIHEIQRVRTEKVAHITSLNPIRPMNEADSWERVALTEIESSRHDFGEMIHMNGVPYYRLMKPLVTDSSCLKCHGSQGYRVGDIRGGISAAVPVDPILKESREHLTKIAAGYVFIWALGIVAITMGYRTIGGKVLALAAAEKRFRTVIEGSADGMMLVSPRDGSIRFSNQALATMLGYSHDMLSSATLDGVLAVNDEHEKTTLLEELISGRRSYGDAIPFRTSSGGEIYMDVSPTMIEMDDESVLLLMLRDATSRKQAEEARLTLLSQQALLGQLASTVAHEVNNPLFAMKMQITQLLKRECVQSCGECVNRLGLVTEQIDRIAGTVRALLGLSRSSKKTEGDTDISAMLETIIRLYQPSFANKGIELVSNIQAGLPLIAGAGSRIQEVLLNIVENARQALTERCEGKVMITARLENGMVRVVIEDNGPGFGENAHKVFQPFFTTKTQGTGLGLAIAKKTIEEFGGSVIAENRSAREGGGARFVLNFKPVS